MTMGEILKIFDDSMEFSLPMREELLFGFSDLFRQEIIVMKDCVFDIKSFVSIIATLME